MINLRAKIRKVFGKKTRSAKRSGKIPAILYGPEIENIPLEVDVKDFKKVFEQMGETSLISLKLEGDKNEKKVLIHAIQRDPINDDFIHIDFYQPSLKQEIEVEVPLIFEGVAPAVKELGGTLVKEIQQIKIKCLPQNLVHDIKIDVSVLKTFDDEILVKDLKVPPEIKLLKNPNEIVAKVALPTKVEEELAKPIEEKVEEVEKVEKKEKTEEVVEEEQPNQTAKEEKTH